MRQASLELARKHQVADGVSLNLDTVPDAEQSAVALQAKLQELLRAANIDV